MNVERIIFDVLLVVILFLVPWWAVGIIILIFFWRYAPYYEGVIFGLILDSLYTYNNFGLLFTFLSVGAIFISLYAHERFRLTV